MNRHPSVIEPGDIVQFGRLPIGSRFKQPSEGVGFCAFKISETTCGTRAQGEPLFEVDPEEDVKVLELRSQA